MTETKRPREPFAPWDRRALPGLFDVEETAKRVGHYKWVELKLFEALGGWVATVPELDIKLRLGLIATTTHGTQIYSINACPNCGK